MSLPYQILAIIVALVLAFGAGWAKRGQLDDLKAKADIAASLEESRETERKRQEVFNQTARHLANEINSISVHRDSLLKRLRDNQNRASVPTSTGTDCPRPTWRTVPAEMGIEVVREVAERDQFREGLIACYAAMDSLR